MLKSALKSSLRLMQRSLPRLVTTRTLKTTLWPKSTVMCNLRWALKSPAAHHPHQAQTTPHLHPTPFLQRRLELKVRMKMTSAWPRSILISKEKRPLWLSLNQKAKVVLRASRAAAPHHLLAPARVLALAHLPKTKLRLEPRMRMII